MNFVLERYNADFRYRMIRIRENAESIALYRGEPDEERGLRGAFARIYDTWWTFMKYTKRLTWLTAFYGQAAAVFPIVVAAPQYFAGQITLGVLTQTADAFAQVQGALSWFVDTYRAARRMEGGGRPAHELQRGDGHGQAGGSADRPSRRAPQPRRADAGGRRGPAAERRAAAGATST